jgi:hypothetical protein
MGRSGGANLADKKDWLKGMLPGVDALFTLVRQLAARAKVTEVSVPKWLVQRHGLAPLLAWTGVSGYREDLARSTLAWATTDIAIRGLVSSLDAAGVRAALIKGASYAPILYDHPAERPMTDVDLLVRVEDHARAMRVLSNAGFLQGNSAALHHAAPWIRGDFVIDLHTNIIGPGRSRIGLSDVWSRMTAGWCDGALQLEPSDALAFHLVHLARNRLRLPLVNVVDAARLMERASVEQVLERSRDWGLGRPVSLALDLCNAILQGRPGRPAGWLGPSRREVALFEEPNAATKVVFDVMTAGSAPQLLSRVIQVAANKLKTFVGTSG